MATTFKVNDNTEIVCKYSSTRNGFCHRATLFVNEEKKCSAVASYLNRTWESYEYESVLRKLLDKAKITSKEESKALLEAWGKNPNLNGMGALGALASVAMMGEVLCDTLKEKNDWKARMLSTKSGFSFPENWNELSEEEKKRRLDGAIESLKL
jgi:hypothetical protein